MAPQPRAGNDAAKSVTIEVAAGARLAEIQMEWRDLIARRRLGLHMFIWLRQSA